MDSVYGWWGGQWGGRRAEGGFFHAFEQKSSHCVFIEVHKQLQFTCQVDMVTDSSLIPSVALLVFPSGTAHSIVECHEFTGSYKRCWRKQTWLFVFLPLICWLSCQQLFGFQFLRDCFAFLQIQSQVFLNSN